MKDFPPPDGIYFGLDDDGIVTAASWFGEKPLHESVDAARKFCSKGKLTPKKFSIREKAAIERHFTSMREGEPVE